MRERERERTDFNHFLEISACTQELQFLPFYQQPLHLLGKCKCTQPGGKSSQLVEKPGARYQRVNIRSQTPKKSTVIWEYLKHPRNVIGLWTSWQKTDFILIAVQWHANVWCGVCDMIAYLILYVMWSVCVREIVYMCWCGICLIMICDCA